MERRSQIPKARDGLRDVHPAVHTGIENGLANQTRKNGNVGRIFTPANPAEGRDANDQRSSVRRRTQILG